MVQVRPLLPFALASSVLGGTLALAQEKSKMWGAIPASPTIMNIPNDFPATIQGRKIAKAMAWASHRRNKMSEKERVGYDSTPPNNFVYDSFLKEWKLEVQAVPYPHFNLSFHDLRGF